MTVEIICPNCNFSKKLPKEKIPEGVRLVICPRCNQRFELKTQEFSRGSPWEMRSDLGIWQGIYQTFKSVLFSPEKFFSGMAKGGRMVEPLSFGLLFGSLGMMFGLFWKFLLISDKILFLTDVLLDSFLINYIFLGIIIISPIFVLLKMFVTGAIIHLFLLIARGGKSGFKGTFRVVGFSQATHILSIIPFIGEFAGSIWSLIVLVIGLKTIHNITYSRVIIALLIPVGLIFLAVIAAVVSVTFLF